MSFVVARLTSSAGLTSSIQRKRFSISHRERLVVSALGLIAADTINRRDAQHGLVA
ncbi:hypothetical protein PZN02_005970 (plasmid) [Sinorhizobium garamanticum]|uniref:Transposase n=1 Tax=Sinorhizobium garamanticum TaxID=680247 RepID=A0ABY8DQ38_9HYPH|nr:hypothetical protein [Sinorhizobium garamanticum]WEX91675.1 hypothetical protein PZN02_005970 [Sinorhizobium garamanticum]